MNHQEQLLNEYKQRIHRVQDYAEQNLDKNLFLNDLAAIANFSPFHFHRIYRALTGETIKSFIQRLRLEKAASQLRYNPNYTITDIAFNCGFSGSAAFARAFRDFFGVSAGEFRKQPEQFSGKCETETKGDSKICKTESNNRQTNSNLRKEIAASVLYIDTFPINQIWRYQMIDERLIEVQVRKLPAVTVAYIRHIGAYKGDSELFASLYQRLFRWAGPRGLIKEGVQLFSVYHDDINLTDEDKLRADVCIAVDKNCEVDGEIGKMELPSGQYACAHFIIDVSEYEAAWNFVFGRWLPESGYQPAEGPCFEKMLNNPDEHPEKKHEIEICIPVKPL